MVERVDLEENKEEVNRQIQENREERKGNDVDQEVFSTNAKKYRSRTTEQNREEFFKNPKGFVEGLGFNPGDVKLEEKNKVFSGDVLTAFNKLYYNFEHPEFKPDKLDSFSVTRKQPEEYKSEARKYLEKSFDKVDSLDQLSVEQVEQLLELNVSSKNDELKIKDEKLGGFVNDPLSKDYLRSVRNFYWDKKKLEAYNAEFEKNANIVWNAAKPEFDKEAKRLSPEEPEKTEQAAPETVAQPQPEPQPQPQSQPQPQPQPEQKPVEQPGRPSVPIPGIQTEIPAGAEAALSQAGAAARVVEDPAAGFRMSYEAEAKVRESNSGASLRSIVEAFANAKTPEDAFQNAFMAALLYLPNKIAWGFEYAQARAREKNDYIEARLREQAKEAREQERADQEAARERAAQEREERRNERDAEDKYEDDIAAAKGLSATDRLRSVHSELFEAMGDIGVAAANLKKDHPELLKETGLRVDSEGKVFSELSDKQKKDLEGLGMHLDSDGNAVGNISDEQKKGLDGLDLQLDSTGKAFGKLSDDQKKNLDGLGLQFDSTGKAFAKVSDDQKKALSGLGLQFDPDGKVMGDVSDDQKKALEGLGLQFDSDKKIAGKISDDQKKNVEGLGLQFDSDGKVGNKVSDDQKEAAKKLGLQFDSAGKVGSKISDDQKKNVEKLGLQFDSDGKVAAPVSDEQKDQLKSKILAKGYFDTYGRKPSNDKMIQLMEQSKAFQESGTYANVGKEMAEEKAAKESVENSAKEEKNVADAQSLVDKQAEIDKKRNSEKPMSLDDHVKAFQGKIKDFTSQANSFLTRMDAFGKESAAVERERARIKEAINGVFRSTGDIEKGLQSLNALGANAL
ncbi:MAG: hypothetical protein J6Y03_04780 [Alphaproteobacteria bacterium]|nr:hypothetical protein [Alphaproteobacteria bacterium]